MNTPVAISPTDVDTLMAGWVTGKVLAEPAISGLSNLRAVSIYFDRDRITQVTVITSRSNSFS